MGNLIHVPTNEVTTCFVNWDNDIKIKPISTELWVTMGYFSHDYLTEKDMFPLHRYSRGGKNKYYKIKPIIREHRNKIRKESFAILQNLVKVPIQKTA